MKTIIIKDTKDIENTLIAKNGIQINDIKDLSKGDFIYMQNKYKNSIFGIFMGFENDFLRGLVITIFNPNNKEHNKKFVLEEPAIIIRLDSSRFELTYEEENIFADKTQKIIEKYLDLIKHFEEKDDYNNSLFYKDGVWEITFRDYEKTFDVLLHIDKIQKHHN